MVAGMQYQEVIDFWFSQLEPKQWWVKDKKLDATISDRFGPLHLDATQSNLFEWRDSPRGRLAEIIVLDQFSRNIYRDQPSAFAADPLALALSQEAVRAGADESLGASERAFLYMPHMHSESTRVHEVALALFENGPKENFEFEQRHKAVIDRFGRYPHRNAILGRQSTAEEAEFLAQPGSSF